MCHACASDRVCELRCEEAKVSQFRKIAGMPSRAREAMLRHTDSHVDIGQWVSWHQLSVQLATQTMSDSTMRDGLSSADRDFVQSYASSFGWSFNKAFNYLKGTGWITNASQRTTSASPSTAAVETTTEQVTERLPSLFQNASRNKVPRDTLPQPASQPSDWEKGEVDLVTCVLFTILFVAGLIILIRRIEKRKYSPSRQRRQQNQNAIVATGNTPSSARDTAPNVTLLRISLPSTAPAAAGAPSAPAAAGTPSAPSEPSEPAAGGTPSAPAAAGMPSASPAAGTPSAPAAAGTPSPSPCEDPPPAYHTLFIESVGDETEDRSDCTVSDKKSVRSEV